MTQTFESFLRRFEEASTAFVNGDASLWDGDWKIAHRHADHLAPKTPRPAS